MKYEKQEFNLMRERLERAMDALSLVAEQLDGLEGRPGFSKLSYREQLESERQAR